MKKIIGFLLFAILCLPVFAQNSGYEKTSREAMSMLSSMLGDWRSESWKITQTDKIGPFIVEYHAYTKMNGNLMFIELDGTNPQSGNIENLSIINYDVPENSYKMFNYSEIGVQPYYLKVLEPNKKIEYGYEMKNRGKVRISLTLNDDGKTATQNWEFSTDGKNWSKIQEENLTKI